MRYRERVGKDVQKTAICIRDTDAYDSEEQRCAWYIADVPLHVQKRVYGERRLTQYYTH